MKRKKPPPTPNVLAQPKAKAGAQPGARMGLKFEPTAEQRAKVESLSAYGIPQPEIARHLGIKDPKTLRKHFADEIAAGKTKFVALAAETLHRVMSDPKAMDRDRARCAMFILKCRGGWRERDVVEHVGKNGGHIQHLDLSKLSDDELGIVERLIRKAGLGGAGEGPAEPPADRGREEPTRH